jgi:hypothetical protein
VRRDEEHVAIGPAEREIDSAGDRRRARAA